jgi:GrpB-like predicted nucleotidyltransferase (UPF0157 family)
MWNKFTVVGGAILLVASLVTSGFVLEDRFNNQDDHDKDILNERKFTEMQLDKVEEHLVMNLKEFRMEQQAIFKSQKRESDYRYYTNLLENIQSQIYSLRQWLREHPNDSEAKEDYKNLKEKRDIVKGKLNNLVQ